jgi:predicted CXXCH cytochrome family protein
MKEKYLLLLLLMVTLIFSTPCLAAPKGKSAPKMVPGAGVTATCLKCHGPFEKLASAPPSYETAGKEKISPHRFVPHDLKEIEDCLDCHKQHSAVPTKEELAALPRPNVKACYSCHHTENFTRCKTCHKAE